MIQGGNAEEIGRIETLLHKMGKKTKASPDFYTKVMQLVQEDPIFLLKLGTRRWKGRGIQRWEKRKERFDEIGFIFFGVELSLNILGNKFYNELPEITGKMTLPPYEDIPNESRLYIPPVPITGTVLEMPKASDMPTVRISWKYPESSKHTRVEGTAWLYFLEKGEKIHGNYSMQRYDGIFVSGDLSLEKAIESPPQKPKSPEERWRQNKTESPQYDGPVPNLVR